MKVLLIDDHVSFCEGLIAALASTKAEYEMVFESDAELVPQALLGRSEYDLFIIDLTMPGLGGIELLKYLNKNKSLTPVVVMSSVLDIETIKQVFRLGAIGYMPKSYSVYQIVDAIEECRRGNIHIPAMVAGLKWAEIRREFADAKEPDDVVESRNGTALTRRQIEIISLMDKGFSNQEIADTLFISKATVKTHVNQLFKVFEVTNRISCLRAAKKAGLLVAS